MAQASLVGLAESDQALADTEKDTRGWKVIDRTQVAFGQVEDLLIDPGHAKVRFLLVSVSESIVKEGRKILIPVEVVEHTQENALQVNEPLEYLVGAPAFTANIVRDEKYWNELYNWYGLTPYWAPGYGAG